MAVPGRWSVQALASPAVPSCPEGTKWTGRPLVVDALFMGAADDPIDYDNRLGFHLGDEGQHLFRTTGCGFLKAVEFGCKPPLSWDFCRRRRIG
jgi:hypothetical protein